AAHSGKAFRAAWTARSASASLPLGTVAMTTLRSVGVMTSVVSPAAAPTHWAPMGVVQCLASGNSDIAVLSFNDEILQGEHNECRLRAEHRFDRRSCTPDLRYVHTRVRLH